MHKHEELFKLIKENPELPIVPMVDNDICGGDYSYYMGEWGNARIDEYCSDDERIYFRLNDSEDLVEKICDDKYDDEWKGKADEEMEKLAEDIVNGYEWVKCIVIRIECP